jgi:hypothetical protein
MLTCEALALFVSVGDIPGGELVVPVASARAAAQAARHLTEYCPHTQATWRVNPHSRTSQVVVLGCARPQAGEDLLDQDAHAFLLAAGSRRGSST